MFHPLIGALLLSFARENNLIISPNVTDQDKRTLTVLAGHVAAEIRMNQIQVVGTHNSYHREVTPAERKVIEEYVPGMEDLFYSHTELPNQLSDQFVRSLELDLHSDVNGGLYYEPLIWQFANLTNATKPFDSAILKKPGVKVFHVTDIDTNADALACALGGVCSEEATNWTLARILNVDKEILSVFKTSKLIRPDDIRKDHLTLEQSILQNGWPRLDDVQGRFMFFFDNDPAPSDPDSPREVYIKNAPSLQNRVVFTNSLEGHPDCAVIKMNEPRGNNTAEIQRLVRKGYIVRTRADAGVSKIRNATEQRTAAFASGAQIVSTDYPARGMSARWGSNYVAELGCGRYARCNPVNAPAGCQDGLLEQQRHTIRCS